MNKPSTLRYSIIVNPHSARGESGRAIPRVRALLDAAGLDYRLEETEEANHAIELARDDARAGIDVVVAMGGDGILNEVLNGLMLAKAEGHDRTALALLPVGRGNDFAWGAGLPLDLEGAVAALVDNRRQKVDLGVARGGDYPEGRWFANGMGIGFDAVVNFEAHRMTHLTGFISYAVAAFKTILLFYKAPRVRIEFGGFQTDLNCLLISVMVGQRMGGGFLMAPEGRNDDGLFDLCVGQSFGKLAIFRMIPHFMKGTQFDRRGIMGGRTAKLTVTALKGALPAQADGEKLCLAGQRLEIESLPGAIEVVGAGVRHD